MSDHTLSAPETSPPAPPASLDRGRFPQPVTPPIPNDSNGQPRTVGVEVEFGALDARSAAECVRSVFGGRLEMHGQHDARVTGTPYGAFGVKLDSQYLHVDLDLRDITRRFGRETARALGHLAREAGNVMGDIARVVVPMEVVGPPMPWTDLGRMDAMVETLAQRGAEGTRDGLFYAFGLQMNPALPSLEPESLVRHLQAFLLATPWLRARIQVDRMRSLLPYVDRFPQSYAAEILRRDYRPDLETLVEDYLWHNATRNRELDMLPAFAHLLGEERMRIQVGDERIKARPTFHYRLPNAILRADMHVVVQEWNRWVAVERLAADRTLLFRLIDMWWERRHARMLDVWAETAAPYLDPLCPE